jgi:acyl dehydratase
VGQTWTSDAFRTDLESTVKWAASTVDFTAFHFDADVATELGYEGPVVHGTWKAAVLRRHILAWLGSTATLSEFAVEYRRTDIVGRELRSEIEIDGVEELLGAGLRVSGLARILASDDSATTTARFTATVPPVREGDSLPIDELKRAVRLGEIAGEFTYRIDESDVRRFREALGLHGEVREGDDAPTTFFAALDPVERRDLNLDGFLLELPFPMTGGGNATNEVEYSRPFRVGDVVTVTTRYTEVYEKTGSRGTLLFRVRVNDFVDADGAPIAQSRCSHVLSFDMTSMSTARGKAR